MQNRARDITIPHGHGGIECKHTVDTRKCNTAPCPVHCGFQFSPWVACSKSCGTGETSRHAIVHQVAKHGGNACPEIQKRACNPHSCPVDCVQTAWSAWSACSKSCGSGVSVRDRRTTTAAALGGVACGVTHDSKTCNAHACPIDCVVSQFSAYNACSATCGTGVQTKKRTVDVAVQFGGKVCPALSSQRDCNAHACPTDCVVGAWGSWSSCSLTCGGGEEKRHRSVQVEVAYGGKACDALEDTAACKQQACPVDCVATAWTAWSECSHSCGQGTETRSRRVTVSAAHGGKDCGALSQSQTCNSGPCPIHCDVTAFGAWSQCSKTCGTGFQTRTRQITKKADFGGVACPFLGEYRKCNEKACPIDCVLSDWNLWTACTKSCGTGQTSRDRTVAVATDFGGKACGVLAQQKDCNAHACAENCVVSPWGPWSMCTKTCGGGITKKHRTVTRAAAFGGKPCATLNEEKACEAQACPMDCVMAAWSTWSTCTKSCGAGTHGRSRVVASPNANGGKACGALTEERQCNHTDDARCPIDCKVSAWSGWTQCSKSCGSGFKSHERTIQQKPLRGGVRCPVLVQTIACNGHKCAIDCSIGQWGAWGKCSQACGGGKRARTRPILGLAMHGGKQCPSLSELEPCNTQGCKCSHVKCEFSKHSATGHMRIKVLHHNAEQHGHSHVCGFDYASGSCQCKCFGAQKWDPQSPIKPRDSWKAKSFPLEGREPAMTSMPNGYPNHKLQGLVNTMNALDASHLTAASKAHKGDFVQPGDHHQCNGADGKALGSVLQVIKNLKMDACMAACNDEAACNCVALVKGDCRLSTGLEDAREGYTANRVGGGEQLIQMQLPAMPKGVKK